MTPERDPDAEGAVAGFGGSPPPPPPWPPGWGPPSPGQAPPWPPAPPAPVTPSGIIGAAGFVVALIAGGLAGAVAIAATRGVDGLLGTEPGEAADLVTPPVFAASAAGTGLTMLGFAWLAAARVPGSRLRALGYRPEPVGALAAAAGVALLARIASVLCAFAALQLVGGEEPPEQVPEAAFAGWWLPLSVLIVVGLAPVAEESLFRGVLQPCWGRRLGMVGIVLSAALFGVGHIDPSTVAGLVVTPAAIAPVAAALAWLRHRWSTTLSAVGHATFNLTAVVLIVLFGI